MYLLCTVVIKGPSDQLLCGTSRQEFCLVLKKKLSEKCITLRAIRITVREIV